MELVANGGDPAGVSFDAADAVIHFEAGNFREA
jgi:hypothetical protein